MELLAFLSFRCPRYHKPQTTNYAGGIARAGARNLRTAATGESKSPRARAGEAGTPPKTSGDMSLRERDRLEEYAENAGQPASSRDDNQGHARSSSAHIDLQDEYLQVQAFSVNSRVILQLNRSAMAVSALEQETCHCER